MLAPSLPLHHGHAGCASAPPSPPQSLTALEVHVSASPAVSDCRSTCISVPPHAGHSSPPTHPAGHACPPPSCGLPLDARLGGADMEGRDERGAAADIRAATGGVRQLANGAQAQLPRHHA
eukprot:358605-Chlamydomonas_euryale.AAC.1